MVSRQKVTPSDIRQTTSLLGCAVCSLEKARDEVGQPIKKVLQ